MTFGHLGMLGGLLGFGKIFDTGRRLGILKNFPLTVIALLQVQVFDNYLTVGDSSINNN